MHAEAETPKEPVPGTFSLGHPVRAGAPAAADELDYTFPVTAYGPKIPTLETVEAIALSCWVVEAGILRGCARLYRVHSGHPLPVDRVQKYANAGGARLLSMSQLRGI